MRYSKTHTVQYRLGIGTQKIGKIYVFWQTTELLPIHIVCCIVLLFENDDNDDEETC